MKKSKGEVAYDSVNKLNQDFYNILTQINNSYKAYHKTFTFNDNTFTILEFSAKAKTNVTFSITLNSNSDVILYHNKIAIAKLYPNSNVLMSIECAENNVLSLDGQGECDINFSICGNIVINDTESTAIYNIGDSVFVCKNTNNTCQIDVINKDDYMSYPNCQKTTHLVGKVLEIKQIKYNDIITYAVLCKSDNVALYIGNFDSSIVLPNDTVSISALSQNGYAYTNGKTINIVADTTTTYDISMSNIKKIVGVNYVSNMTSKTVFIVMNYSGVLSIIKVNNQTILDTMIRLQGNDFEILCDENNVLFLYNNRSVTLYDYNVSNNEFKFRVNYVTKQNLSIIGSNIVSFSNDYIAPIKQI